jgi:Golgi nucleoside diphosphatase
MLNNKQQNPYNIAAPEYSPVVAPSPTTFVEGEILYGQQNFSNKHINATAAILESGQAFWQDIFALNHSRKELAASIKTDKYKKSRESSIISLEQQANASEIRLADMRNKIDREIEEMTKKLQQARDAFGPLGGPVND